MAQIYMTHPEHGAMHAINDYEAERLEKSGWKRGEQERPPVFVDEVPVQHQEMVPVKRGPGRPRKNPL